MSTLGIVIPTKNSRAYLPRHLQGLVEWQDLAAEIVVVDSFSEDGTLDFLQSHLRHPGLRVISHPPGLYESWNHGLRQLSTDYAYIATVGDTITRAGVEHLLAVAAAHHSDVVMSKARFIELDGTPAADVRWPLDEILEYLCVTEPRRLRPLEFLILATAHLGGGLLGSSASNLYRTRFLQAHPFPAEFGMGGDGAWAVLHAHDAAWSLTPKRFSTFLVHPPAVGAMERKRETTARRLDEVLREALIHAVHDGNLTDEVLAERNVPELLATATRWLDAKQRFDQARKARWPWVLRPAAWFVRMERNRCRRTLRQLQDQALSKLSPAAT